MTLHLKFRNWITLCVAFPTAILLVVVNLNLHRGLRVAHNAALLEANHQLYAQLEGILSAEGVRLRSLASIPITESLLASVERKKGGLSLDRRKEANAKVEGVWPTLKRSDLQVRNVLDNTVGALFGHLRKSRERSSKLLLTDAAGALIASSYRPEHYDFSNQAWWKKTRDASSDRILGEGVSAEGTIALTLAIWGDYQTRVLEGVLKETVSLNDYDFQLNREAESVGLHSVIVGKNSWFVHASDDLAGEAKAYLNDFVTRSSGSAVWSRGFRFTSRPLDANLQWLEPLYVVSLSKESRFPLSLWGPQVLSLLVSCILLGALIFFSNRAGKHMFFDPMHHLMEAGAWVMQRVLKSDKDAHLLAEEFKQDAPSPIYQDLETWLTGLEQGMEDAMNRQAYDMQQDLALARDFQLAYMNRPYPKIPAHHTEGRLRLALGHRYHPAQTLRGDFFDLRRLPDECAGIFIGDVAGHGTRSVLITAILRTLISDLAHQGRNVSHFMAEMNKQFCNILKKVPDPQYAACFYFVADTIGRVATYSTAGHRPPYLLRRNIGRVTQLPIPEPHGAALGVIPNETYTGGHTRLTDGDFYLFHTNGICGTLNESGEEFGADRLEGLLKRLVYKSMDTILDGILAEVQNFAGEEPITEDLCLLAVEVTTKADLGV